MDSFLAVPTSSTTDRSLTSESVRVVEELTPIITSRSGYVTATYVPTVDRIIRTGLGLSVPTVVTTTTRPFVSNVTSLINPASMYYYDSGIGENPLAQHETNQDLRYKFLDKWLYEDHDACIQILKMLKVVDGRVKVLSKSEAKNNDISKDSEKDLELKADFIGFEILSLSKNRKILDTLIIKNNLKWYDLPHNESYVRKAQAKYVLSKLEDMQSK